MTKSQHTDTSDNDRHNQVTNDVSTPNNDLGEQTTRIKVRHAEAYRINDFRRKLLRQERQAVRERRARQRALQERAHVDKHVITVDTSKARSNSEVVRMCIRELKWKEFPLGRRQPCDIHWHGVEFRENRDLCGGQVNKFPGMVEILGKINVARSLDLMRDLFPDEYNFYPKTWLLPQQLYEFSHDARTLVQYTPKSKPKPTFIVKPDEGSQGGGIYLIRDPLDYVSGNRSHVVQEYLNRPLLIDKLKFDFRIYVVLKSISPLEIHICKEGLARFCTIPYRNPTTKNINEAFMHLTNYSLNKKSSTYNPTDREDEGSKRTVSSVLTRLRRMGYDVLALWNEIEKLVCKTMIALTPELMVAYRAELPLTKPAQSCFQILGFDILLLDNLQPMLLEVNSSPSLRLDFEHEVAPGIVQYVPSFKDTEIKFPLVRDTLLMMAPKDKLAKMYKEGRHSCRSQPDLDNNANHTRHRSAVRREHKSANFAHYSSEHENSKSQTEQASDVMAENTRHKTHNSTTSHNILISWDKTDDKSREDVEQPIGNTGDVGYFSQLRDERSPIEYQYSLMPDITDNGAVNESISNKTIPDDYSNTGDDNKESFADDRDDSLKEWYQDTRLSCLKGIFPLIYGDEFDRLRIFERIAHIFLACLGVRVSLRIGPTGFRMFTRKCRLTKKGITNAEVDILYIDMQRRWDYMNPERTAGLCYQGFVGAFMEIANRKFYSTNKLEMVENLVDFCEANMENPNQLFSLTPGHQLLRRRLRNVPTRISHHPTFLSEILDELDIRGECRHGVITYDTGSRQRKKKKRIGLYLSDDVNG